MRERVTQRKMVTRSSTEVSQSYTEKNEKISVNLCGSLCLSV